MNQARIDKDVIDESKDSVMERRSIFLRLDVNVVIFYGSPKSLFSGFVFGPAGAVILFWRRAELFLSSHRQIGIPS